MILSHMQLEEIASAVTKDFNEFFFGKDTDNERSTAQATPIDQFAKDYLGLSVSFAHLSSDGSLCGLTAYADTEYTIIILVISYKQIVHIASPLCCKQNILPDGAKTPQETWYL